MTITIVDCAISVALGLLSLAAAYATAYINKAKQKIQTETKDRLRAMAFDGLNELIATTVGEMEQTIGKDLRQKVKEGLENREKLLALKNLAFTDITAQLKPEYQRILKDNLQDVTGYIMSAIEKELLIVKTITATTVLSELQASEG